MSLANLEALNNLACNVGSACPGKVSIAIDSVTRAVDMKCVPEGATLNVNLVPPPGYTVYQTCYSTSQFCGGVNNPCSWQCNPQFVSQSASVTSNPAGIAVTCSSGGSCGGTSSFQFCKGQAVTLTLGWSGTSTVSGDCTSTANCTLVMDAAKAVTFTAQ
jgi:hypothetical protein